MHTNRIKGFIDPIILGFIVALVGTASVLAVERSDDALGAASHSAQESAVAEQSASYHAG